MQEEQLTGRSSRGRTALAGGLALLPVLAVAVLWLRYTHSGQGSGLFDIEEPGAPAAPVSAAGGGWYEVFFTVPQEEPTWLGGLDRLLAADIDNAQSSVDVAAYELNLQSITDALVRAHRRGVRVRMVTDSDNIELDHPRELIEASIPVVGDGRSATMHNKFAVLDGFVTWTGSWNLTDNGTYRNNNNAIRIVSERLAQNYVQEFEEMFLENAFGATSPAATPHTRLSIEGTPVETRFAPEDGVMERVLEIVSSASESIRFLAFSFTDERLGATMLERARAGVLVEGVFEGQGAVSEYSRFSAMQEAGLNVWRDGGPAVMHHKVVIIDSRTVILGSFNLTASADSSNDENLIIVDTPEIAAHYSREFERIISRARP